MSRVLDRARTALVVVDVQEAFRPAVGEFDAVAANAAVLVQAARALELPVVVTEQYPRGLGETVPEVAEHLDGVARVEKTVFSAARADGFSLDGRDQALVCGIEAHVCVQQTAQDLLDAGVEVHVAADAVTSRTALNRRLGLEKMEASGAVVTSTEMALFELVERAGTPEFKTIQALVK
ncbi:MAG TPA: isochorismatase family protein [Solirubrobacteraceae bacterium]|nr:isochorismatase family protein [Solirubrobacteraceae bacterium]